ncbi:APR-like 4 [Perilla frutescens var. hirtella]|uniref:APR-like 4 n=1 Tax=Perilla frutescens var. hirtella TaxID=608512 RepID=A0AAD4NY30_PERFH|nr:APR-like 4 [Perilla frutescens var. hirtella]KAH6782374.1 APR-like 4 [Perilla frutescens var. frutescens]KAH6800308.1 APR-like 4 [Perilla frutescens var. hirtella]
MGDLRRISELAGLTVLLLLGRLTCADAVRVPSRPVCPLDSLKDSIFASRRDVCYISRDRFSHSIGVIEGDEVALQKALHMVHTNENDYVSVLFYSAWCPFSATFKPKLSILSSIYPSIPHFAIEESSVRPSILSKYGVYGFPTLILLNSTMRVRYQGSRTLDSLVTFYGDVTGLKTASADPVYLEKIGCSGYDEKHKTHQETCPFPWAKSPENLLQQETYLALATIFVIMRLLYYTFPTLRRYGQLAWRRYVTNASFSSVWEHLVVHINRLLQLFKSLNEPCKKSNLQEGAKNAKAWASKSLATVSFGDASSSHNVQ